MLKYRLKGGCINPNSKTPIKDYLRSLGITKVESFLAAPPKEDEISGRYLNDIDRCIDMLHELFTTKQRILLIVDCDVDGFTSASIFYRFFKGYYEDASITYWLHEGKEHGIEQKKIPALDTFDAIVLPDAGSMQIEEQQWLLDNGKKVIIIDHHNVTATLIRPNLVLVNNQNSPNFANKDLSGAGMVLKVIQLYGLKHPHLKWKANYFYDLAALGIIADCMDMRSLDNNYIVYQGLHNIQNEMFKALLSHQQFKISDLSNPTKVDVAYYIAPIINGVIRAGTQEEKELLFRGFIENPTEDSIQTEYRGRERNESFYAYVARTAYNIKNRQNTTKMKCFEFLCEKIESEGLDKNKVIAVIASASDKVTVPQTITGLIAMELLKKYNRPVLVLRPRMDNGVLTYAGSGRAKELDELPSFLQMVRDSDASVYGEGHACAFGASILATEYENFINECNEKLKDVEFENDCVDVDVVFKDQRLNEKLLYEFANYAHIYGNSIPQPKIAIEATVTKNAINIMGADKTSVGIMIDGIKCVKFKDANLASKFSTNDKLFRITLLGRPQMSYWLGNASPQMMIDSIDVEPILTKTLF